MAVSSLLIATKYEEIYPPEVRDMLKLAEKGYTKEQVLKMEYKILSTLDFNVTFPTALRFLERYAKLTGACEKVMLLASYFLESCLLDVSFL